MQLCLESVLIQSIAAFGDGGRGVVDSRHQEPLGSEWQQMPAGAAAEIEHASNGSPGFPTGSEFQNCAIRYTPKIWRARLPDLIPGCHGCKY
jgi:hypothetical protein